MNPAIRFGLFLMVAIVVGVLALFLSQPQIEDAHVGLLMLGLVVVAIMLGFPAAFTLMGMGVLFGLYAFHGEFGIVTNMVVQRTYAILTHDVLVAIPLFIFMGYLVERANLIKRLFEAMHVAMARVPGALAVATLVTCTLFSTATGVVGAVIALMGLLALPAMLRAGYDDRLASGVVAAGGCLGTMIPPSVLLIVYGATAGVSIVQLYAGAIFPGLLLAGMYIIYVIVLAKLKPHLAPPLTAEQRQVPLPAFAMALPERGNTHALTALSTLFKGRRNNGVPFATLAGYTAVAALPLLAFLAIGVMVMRGMSSDEGVSSLFWIASVAGAAPLAGLYAWFNFSRLEVLKMMLGSFVPLAVLIVAVLGSIVFGLATPTEAAAVGALGGCMLALAYRRLNYTMVKESLYLTAKTTAMVGWLFIGAGIFSSVFALLGGQRLIEEWVISMDLTPLQFMILAQLIIFVLGWPLDWAEIIVIFVPIFIPLLDHFGINPLFFGLLVAMNLQTAFLSPPVAMAAFYLRGVAPPGVTITKIFLGMLPFLAIQLMCLVVLYMFPAISLWLPAKLYG